MSNEDYRQGYRDGWHDASNPFSKKKPFKPENPYIPPTLPPFPYNPSPVEQKDYSCPVCGITFEFGKAYGYACAQVNCPSKATFMYNFNNNKEGL